MNPFNQSSKAPKDLKKTYQSGEQGFVEFIVVIIIALVILHYLNIDLGTLLQKEWVRNLAIFIRDLLKLVWNDLKIIIDFIKSILN